MPVIQGFELLTSIYLGQEWNDYGATIDDAIVHFARDEEPEDLAASVAGLEQLIRSSMSEQECYERWILSLHSGYDPRDDGFTFPEWFAHALAVLREAAARPEKE